MGFARKEYLWVTVGMFMGEKRLFVNKMHSTIEMQNRLNDYLYNKLL